MPSFWMNDGDDEASYVSFALQWQLEMGHKVEFTNAIGLKKIHEPVNHHPFLMEYEIWCPGFKVHGNDSSASLWGSVEARNFGQACDLFMCKMRVEEIEKSNDKDFSGYIDSARWDYDPSIKTYWGFTLVWSEKIAKKYNV